LARRERERGRERAPGRAAASRDGEPDGLGGLVYAALYAAYLGTLWLVYAPALSGPFVSDDIHYVAANAYVHGLSLENVWAIVQPYGPATVAVVNYSPVQLLMHATVWEFWGAETTAHHLLNLGFHAAASLLLLPLLRRSGLPPAAAYAGSLLFLLHPANVEAVAWISQLKTNAALTLALGAALALPRHRFVSALLFGAALLAKANAAAVLPFAFWLEWVRTRRLDRTSLLIWTGLFAAFALVEFTAHQRAGAAEATLHQTPAVLLRTMAGLAARYAALGYSGFGTSAFHEPEPATSWLDPWWLASLPLLALLGWRLVGGLRHGRAEAGYWLLALVSFGPVSQIFPFLYPFADRYLYFILPGLLGGALFAGREWLAAAPEARRARLGHVALALGLLLCGFFAIESRARAGIWRSPALIVADAAKHYPNGVSARLLRAKAAARLGDAEAAVAELRGAVARGYNRFEQLQTDPAYAPIRHTQVFRSLIREIASGWIEAGRAWQDPTQGELRKLASAHAARGERDRAVELLRQALARGGPLDAAIRADLGRLGAAP
jgi:hypothetical protein